MTDERDPLKTLNRALDVGRLLAEKDAEIAQLRPYYDAVRNAYNGYDPEARAAMPGLSEPATPADAISQLLEEAERDTVAKAKLLKPEGDHG